MGVGGEWGGDGGADGAILFVLDVCVTVADGPRHGAAVFVREARTSVTLS